MNESDQCRRGGRTQRRPNLYLSPAAPALIVLLILAAAGCRTVPEDDPGDVPPDMRDHGISLERVPDDGSRTTSDDVRVNIGLGDLDFDMIDAVIVLIDPDREVRVLPDRTPTGITFRLPLDGLEDGRRYRFSLFLSLTDSRVIPLGTPFTMLIDLGLVQPVLDPSEILTLDPRPVLRWFHPHGDPDTNSDPDAVPDTDSRRTFAVPSEPVLIVDGEEREIRPIDSSVVAFEDDDRPNGYRRADYRPARDLIDAAGIGAGAELSWAVRMVSPRGVLGPPAEPGVIRYDTSASIPVIRSARSGDRSVTARPGMVWDAVNGAERYHLQYHLEDDVFDAPYEQSLDTTRYRLRSEEIEALFVTGLTPRFQWRVRAENRLGVRTPWSEVMNVEVETLAPGITVVLPPGTAAQLQMGAPVGTAGVPSTETPTMEVLIDRPFGMGRYLLTTEAVAELFNQGLRSGELQASEDAVRDPILDLPLLVTESLDFGSQLGLRLETVADAPSGTGGANDGPVPGRRVGFDPEYRAHPAVGVTWHGAVWLLNRLSLLEAREPVYRYRRKSPSADRAVERTGTDTGTDGRRSFRVEKNRNADGYRLPTEAEWALAVGQTERVQVALDEAGEVAPEPVRVTVFRRFSPVALRGINFLRSGDAWEDPMPPYTRAGGPTSPVGALGGASPAGVYDLMGNVWEWTWDWYRPDRSEEGPTLPDNFSGPERALADIYGREMRVVRGGAWNTPREELRPTMRGAFPPTAASHSIGVRPARTLTPEP